MPDAKDPMPVFRGDGIAVIAEVNEVDFDRRAAAAVDGITAARQKWQRANRRPSALTAREALSVLHFEAMLVWTAAHNIAFGVELTDADRERLTMAYKRIDAIVDEVNR